jgi:hypothetical protein
MNFASIRVRSVKNYNYSKQRIYRLHKYKKGYNRQLGYRRVTPAWVYRELRKIDRKISRLNRRIDKLFLKKRRASFLRFGLNRRIYRLRRKVLEQEMRKQFLIKRYFR